MTKHLASELHT